MKMREVEEKYFGDVTLTDVCQGLYISHIGEEDRHPLHDEWLGHLQEIQLSWDPVSFFELGVYRLICATLLELGIPATKGTTSHD